MALRKYPTCILAGRPIMALNSKLVSAAIAAVLSLLLCSNTANSEPSVHISWSVNVPFSGPKMGILSSFDVSEAGYQCKAMKPKKNFNEIANGFAAPIPAGQLEVLQVAAIASAKELIALGTNLSLQLQAKD